MARRILALDLGSHSLKAAVIESTLRHCRVVNLLQQRRDPERSLAEQVQEFCGSSIVRADTVLSCLPGAAVMHRFLSLPFTRTHHLEQTVPPELASRIPFSADEVMVDFQVVRRTQAESTVLAVAVPKSVLTEHLEALAAAGLDPTVVGLVSLVPLALLSLAEVDLSGVSALVDFGETCTSMALLSEGELIGVRTLSIGLSRAGGFPTFLQELRWTLMALGGDELGMPSRFFLCGGGARIPRLRKELEQALDSEILPLQDLFLPPVPEELRHEQGVFAACLGIGLNEALGLSAPRINVRRGSFTHQGQREGLRREFAQLTWVVTGVALAAGLAFALELHRLNTQYEGLRREIRQVFTATLPEVQSIVSEKVQLEDAVATLRGRQRLIGGAGGVSPLDILRQLSAALPDQITVDLDEWTFDTETIRMRGTTSSFDAAETIKTTAAQLGLFQEVQLKDVKTIASGKKVSFGLQMTLGQEGR